MTTTLSATTPLAERAKELVPLLDSNASYADANSQLRAIRTYLIRPLPPGPPAPA